VVGQNNPTVCDVDGGEIETADNRPKSASKGQPPHLDHTVPDFNEIGSLSAELLQNA